jgi:hypothetical protein
MSSLGCSQCGRDLPADPAEARQWEQGPRALAGELDEVTASMLLCPDCTAEDRARAYDEGDPG